MVTAGETSSRSFSSADPRVCPAVTIATAAAPDISKRFTPIAGARSVPDCAPLFPPLLSRNGRRNFRFAGNHDFRRLDDRHRVVSAPELQFLNGVGRDDGRQRLIADAEADLAKEPVGAHLFDESVEA